MKKRKYGKKGIIALLLCVCAVLCSSTVYALVQSDRFVKEKTYAKIEEYDKQIESLSEEVAHADDTRQRELKEELTTVLTEKAELEMETGTYAYDEELEVSINSVSVAVEDSLRFYEQEPEKFTKNEKKRLDCLKSLCDSYRNQISFCKDNNDYKELLDKFRSDVDEINNKYR